jgi:hypothetical protein
MIFGYKLFGFAGILSYLGNISRKSSVYRILPESTEIIQKERLTLSRRMNIWIDHNPEGRQNLINYPVKYSYEYAP